MPICPEPLPAHDAARQRTAALVLSGSRETDAASADAGLPRLSWPVANLPLVEHLRDWLATADVHSLVICTNDAQHLVGEIDASARRSRVAVTFYEDRVPRGPGGAARDAALLSSAAEFLVLEGVALPDVELRHLLAAHRASAAAATVVVSGESHRPGELSSPAGVYVFSRDALLRVPATGYRDIKEVLIPDLHRAGLTVQAYAAAHTWPRHDGLRSYVAAQHWMLERWRRAGVAPPGYGWRGQTCVHASARVSAAARLVGPVMVGRAAQIDDEAILLGPVVVGPECRVGRGAVLGRSVLWDGCEVGAGARLEDCVVAFGVRIGAGAAARGVVSAEGEAWTQN